MDRKRVRRGCRQATVPWGGLIMAAAIGLNYGHPRSTVAWWTSYLAAALCGTVSMLIAGKCRCAVGSLGDRITGVLGGVGAIVFLFAVASMFTAGVYLAFGGVRAFFCDCTPAHAVDCWCYTCLDWAEDRATVGTGLGDEH